MDITRDILIEEILFVLLNFPGSFSFNELMRMPATQYNHLIKKMVKKIEEVRKKNAQ